MEDRLSGFRLTKLQLIVADELCHGRSNRDIAARLGKTEASIRSVVHQILLKTGANNRAHAVAKLVRACNG